jgi:hypothetical protein
MSAAGALTESATSETPDRRRAIILWTVAICGLSVALIFAFVARWYRPGHEIASIDFIPEYDPFVGLAKSFFAWGTLDNPFGSFGSPAFATYFLIYGALSSIGSVALTQIFFFWLFMAVAWCGTFALCRRLQLSFPAAALAAWTFVLNPAEQFWQPFLTADAYAAVLPWVLWALHKAAFEPETRRAICAGFAVAVFLEISWLGATPQLLFELVLVTIAWALFVGRTAAAGYARWIGQTTVLCAIAASWWIVPVLFMLFGNRVTHATSAPSVTWAFANSSLLNNLRFIPMWFWLYPYYNPYAHGYDANAMIYAAGFWGAVMLAIGLSLRHARLASTITFFAAVALVGMFVTKGFHPPLEQINELIMRLPGFFLLEEPAGLMIVSLLAISVVTGIVIDEIAWGPQEVRRFSRALSSALALVTVACALLSASPLLDGTIFSAQPNNYVSVPAYWRAAAAYVNAVHGEGSVLVLPPDSQYQAAYDWGYHAADALAIELFQRPVLQLGPAIGYVADPRYEAIKRKIEGMLIVQDENTVSTLRSLGVRFIVCRRDTIDSRTTFPNDVCFTRFLEKIVPSTRYGKLTVYDLGSALPAYRLFTSTGQMPLRNRTVWGFAHVVDVPPAAGTFVNGQLFNRTWVAVATSPPKILPHGANDWQNAWTTSSGGTVVVFNAINALELMLLLIGFAAVCWSVVRVWVSRAS